MSFRYSILAAVLAIASGTGSLAYAQAQPAEQSQPTAEIHAVRVSGVGHHPTAGIDPARMQAIADQALLELGGVPPAKLGFGQMEEIARRINATYREADFLVATAFLPEQSIGEDRVLHVQVIEGTIGRVLVQGSERYRDDQLSASSLGLLGRPLRQRELERAIMHAEDLPGVSVRSVLRAGEHPGETDIILVAEDSARPYEVHAALSNHGTDSTGRYRAEAGITAFNALGAGDTLAATVGYGLNPADSWYASAALSIPSSRVTGLSGTLGFSRSSLELNTGPFAPLDIHGPTTIAHFGANWTFARSPTLTARTTARWIHEESRLDGLGIELSRHKFDVLEAGLSLQHTHHRSRGINVLQASLRKSVNDESPEVNWLHPAHTSHFLIGRLALARLQALPGNQRLLLRGNAQFTSDALAPLEQFSLGGPDSVRAFPLSSALDDRGVQATLEYQVNAPGFAHHTSPFDGRSWADLITVSLFYDWGRTSPASSNRQLGIQPVTLEGAGIGLGLRLPWQPDLRLDVSAATPTGSTKPFDGDDLQVWARIGMTF